MKQKRRGYENDARYTAESAETQTFELAAEPGVSIVTITGVAGAVVAAVTQTRASITVL